MRWRRVAMIAATLCGLLLNGEWVCGQLLDSSLFNHQYNGDTGPNATGYTHNPGTEVTWNPTSDGSILTYQGTILEGGYWQSDDWVLGPDAASNASGWTIEFRAKVGIDAEDDPVGGAFNVFAKDITGNNSQGRRFQVTVGTDFTSVSSLGSVVDTSDNTDAFHVYRFGQFPNSSTGSLWRDGVLIFSGVTRGSNDSSGLASQLWWGDGSSGTGGPTMEVDYVRWDSTGHHYPDRLFGFQPGDLNADGNVDINGDYAILKNNWLQTVTPSIANADLNFDTIVDVFDFVLFKEAYIAANGGGGGELQIPVPEPSALVLLAAALPALLFLTRRRSN